MSRCNYKIFIGYPSSPYTVRPYTEPELQVHQGHERARRHAFNKNLSSIRVYIEHTIGLLKGRFLSLKEMGPHADEHEMYKAINALFVVHNLCIDLGDIPEDFIAEGLAEDQPDDDVDLPDYGGELVILPEDNGHIPAYETDDWHKEAG